MLNIENMRKILITSVSSARWRDLNSLIVAAISDVGSLA